MKIPVIEDSPRMARSLEKGLSERCHAVDVAPDGVSGLHLARTGECDLRLLDINLPDKDGLTVIRELRQRRSDVPVIMVTARDDVRDRIEGLDAGADDSMTKPFAFDELLARIRFGLGLTVARAAARAYGGDLVCRGRPDGDPGAEFVFLFRKAVAREPEAWCRRPGRPGPGRSGED